MKSVLIHCFLLGILSIFVTAIYPEIPEEGDWYYTLSVTGCQCYYDESDWGCACCRNGGCQCEEDTFPHRCDKCGEKGLCTKDPWCQARSGAACYQGFEEPKTWFEAKRSCESMGADLAHLNWYQPVEKINGFIIDNYPDQDVKYWFNLRVISENWAWVSDGKAKPVPYQGCYFDSADNPDLPVLIDYLDYMDPLICINECRNKNKNFASLQMEYSHLSTSRVSGYYARCRCGDKFGQYGETQEANCDQFCPNDAQNRRCGGVGKQMVYLTKVPYMYENWASKDIHTLGRCGALTKIGWKKQHCLEKRPHICQYPLEVCETFSNVYSIEGKCIGLEDLDLTWYEARMNCRDYDGDLLTITTRTMENSVLRLLGDLNEAWIALTGTRWGNSGLSFSNWAEGEPSRDPDSRCALADCVLDFQWRAEKCYEKHAYICQKYALDYIDATSGPFDSTSTTRRPFIIIGATKSSTRNTYSTSTRTTDPDYRNTRTTDPYSIPPGDEGTTIAPQSTGVQLNTTTVIIIAVIICAIFAIITVTAIAVCCYRTQKAKLENSAANSVCSSNNQQNSSPAFSNQVYEKSEVIKGVEDNTYEVLNHDRNKHSNDQSNHYRPDSHEYMVPIDDKTASNRSQIPLPSAPNEEYAYSSLY